MTKGKSLALPGNGERIYARLVSGVSRALNKMLRDENAISGLNRAALADIMGVDKAFVSRKLSGNNMTLRTISAFLAAAGWEMDVSVHRIVAAEKTSNCEPSFFASNTFLAIPASFTPTFDGVVSTNKTSATAKIKTSTFECVE